MNTRQTPCSVPGKHFPLFTVHQLPFPILGSQDLELRQVNEQLLLKVVLGFHIAADTAYLLWAVHHAAGKRWSLGKSSLCGLESFPAFSPSNPSSSQCKINFHCWEEITILSLPCPICVRETSCLTSCLAWLPR